MENSSHRPMTPGEAREHRKQQAMKEYQERMRSLNKERQSILTNEVLWTGKADSQQERQQGNAAAEERARQRMALVQQLQQERAASEAMLEALRANKPFREAQRLARSVASDMRDLQRGDDGEGGGLGSIYATESPGPASNKPSGLSFAVPPNPPPKASSTSLVYHEPQPVSRVPSQFQDPDYQLTQRQGPSVSSRGKKHKNHHRASDESYYRDDYEDSGGGGYDVPARSGQMSFASGLTGGGGMRRGAGGEEASVVAPMVEALKAQMETFANVMAQQQQQQLVQAQQQQQMLQQQQQQIFQQQQQMIQQMATPPIQPSYLPRGQQQQLSPPNRSIQNDNNSMVNDFLPPSNNVKSDREDIRYTDVDSQPRTPNGNDDDELTDHFPLPGSGTDEEETRGVAAKRQGKASQMDIDRARANEATDRTPRIDKARNEAAGGAGGSGTVAVESDDLSVFVHMAGPLEKKGTYRLRVVLYDGFQPLTAGPGLVVGASTSRRKATGDGDEGALTATWNDTAVLRGLRVSPTMMLVFEVYLAKVNVAGLPTHEALIAWGYTSLVTPQGEIPKGSQSIPLFRLPLMISAQRKFSFGGAMLDFSITHMPGLPGDMAKYQDEAAASQSVLGSRGGLKSAAASAAQDLRKKKAGAEDVPGVPVEAWCRVARGIPPSDPFTPGEGFVLLVDGARFLPANITISKVTARIFSSDRKLLVQQMFEAVATPDSDAHAPKYLLQASIGQGRDSQFDNATATLLFAVHTICRYERQQKVVGYAALPLFIDPGSQAQPASRNTREYILNQGSFQIPLHIAPPPPYAPFRGDALLPVPRVPCASLLVRILSPEAAKAQRKKPLPIYSDKVYDSTRSVPSPIDRKLFVKYMTRRPLTVREAARMVVAAAKKNVGDFARKSVGAKQPVPPSEPKVASSSKSESDKSRPGLFSRFKTAANVTKEVAVFSASSHFDDEIGDEFGAAALPSTDAELMDWMEDRLKKDTQNPLSYNLASEYFPDNGFYVAADGAMRLDRNLPAASLITFAPPGSFYLDNPIVDDMKATLDYDLTQPLANPRWLDGYQHFDGVAYEQGLCVIFDVRLLIPSTGASAPAGWTALPIFEKHGQFVATGSYHLPLFQGVPSRFIVQEFGNKGDVEGVIMAQLASGRIRVSEECPSVLVRIMDASRVGQCDVPAGAGPGGLGDLKLPSYLEALGGAKFLATMRKPKSNKSYMESKPKNITEDKFVEQMNECIIKVAGLDTKGLKGERSEGTDDDDDSEFWSDDDDEESEPEGRPNQKRALKAPQIRKASGQKTPSQVATKGQGPTRGR